VKLTKSKLKQLIREEIQKSLQPLQEQGKPCRPMRGVYGKLWELLKEFAGRFRLPRDVKKDLFGTEETEEWSCPGRADVMPIAEMVINMIAKQWQTEARNHGATDPECSGAPYYDGCMNLRKILALEAKKRKGALRNPRAAIAYIQTFWGASESRIAQKFPYLPE